MSWDRSDNKRKGYHHGNLREALIEAALRLISEKGPGGFTVAEAARAAGVSPAAPYRHFRDRDDLIADIALRGYEQFASALRAAWDGGKPPPRAALHRLGVSYLDFARNQPAAYAAMFESGLKLAEHPALRAAADDAFAVLRDACEALVAALPANRKPPALMVALHIWSVAHGIASLFGRSDDGRRPLPMPPEELLEAAILVYLDGLNAAPA